MSEAEGCYGYSEDMEKCGSTYRSKFNADQVQVRRMESKDLTSPSCERD